MQEKLTLSFLSPSIISVEQDGEKHSEHLVFGNTDAEKVEYALALIAPLTNGEIELPDGTIVTGTSHPDGLTGEEVEAFYAARAAIEAPAEEPVVEEAPVVTKTTK